MNFAHYPHGDHVVVDLLPEANAGVKTFFNDIGRHFDNGNVQLDAGILTHKPRKDRFDQKGPNGWLRGVARLVGIEGGVVSGVFNLEII